MYKRQGADPDGQTYELKHKVSSQAEALELAKCQLRQRNKGETTAEFTLVGDVDLSLIHISLLNKYYNDVLSLMRKPKED